MTNREYAVLLYCKDIYGGNFSIEGDFLFISVDSDFFKVNLTDKSRFGEYSFFHRNQQTNLDGNKYSHKQLSCRDLDYGVFRVWTHLFNKSIGIWSEAEDFHSFRNDAWRYRINDAIEENMKGR